MNLDFEKVVPPAKFEFFFFFALRVSERNEKKKVGILDYSRNGRFNCPVSECRLYGGRYLGSGSKRAHPRSATTGPHLGR